MKTQNAPAEDVNERLIDMERQLRSLEDENQLLRRETERLRSEKNGTQINNVNYFHVTMII